MRLTYANVVSTLALFLVLGGGAAYAAHRYLTRKSVGTPQLKRIAVSTAKLKEGAVTTEKIFDGAVTGSKIDAGTVPFGRVVHRASGSALVSIDGGTSVYPLQRAGYTQKPDETDSFVGALDVTFSASCKQPRSATAYLLLDEPNLIGAPAEAIVAKGVVTDTGTGGASRRVELGASESVAPTRFEPGSPTPHGLYLFAESNCASGSGVTADFGGVDVVGVE
jgi:hypothetical protein